MNTDIETIKENNKLIAEFMGYNVKNNKCYSPKYNDGTISPMQFHKSWDWLIPVVKKIESLGYVFSIQGAKAEVGEMLSKPKCFISDDKFSSTYDAAIYIIKEYNKEYIKEYRKNNKVKLNLKSKEYMKNRKKTDSLFKMRCNLGTRTFKFFKYKKWNKGKSTEQLIGCDYESAHKHLERQFTKGMNWSNQGEWHIDHIIPLASANTKEELIKLCHYTNLQPLWAEDNLKKGATIK